MIVEEKTEFRRRRMQVGSFNTNWGPKNVERFMRKVFSDKMNTKAGRNEAFYSFGVACKHCPYGKIPPEVWIDFLREKNSSLGMPKSEFKTVVQSALRSQGR